MENLWCITVLFLVLGASAQMVSQTGDKCSKDFVCPPQYLRLNQNCYYFSKNKTTWQEAFFNCQDLRGKFVIIRNPYQDKSLRSFLNKIALVDVERWIGGMYDWEQMMWKWGASGKEITYKGFYKMDPEDKERLKWHCTVLDPELKYKWNSRSCLEEKHFICQTRLKKIDRTNKKLQRQYQIDKYNKLNEVPVPFVTDYDSNFNLKEHPDKIEISVIGQSAFANRTSEERRRGRQRAKKNLCEPPRIVRNGTEINIPELKYGRRQRSSKVKDNKDEKIEKDLPMDNIETQIYYSGMPESPLHPRVLTEELSFS